MSDTRCRAGLAVLLVALLAGPALAAEQPCDTMISSAPYTISSPGHYCLANNLTYSSALYSSAITIDANAVVLDLRGYEIDGRAGGLGTLAYGIKVEQRGAVTIRNGALRGFYVGVAALDGAANVGNTVEDLTVEDSRFFGIYVGSGPSHVIRRCRVDNTGQSPHGALGGSAFGIYLGGGSSVVSGNMVTRTLSGSGSSYGIVLATSHGIAQAGASRAVDNQVMGDGSPSSFCFSFSQTGDVYRDNVASACAVPYLGGTAVGATNHP